MKGIAELPNCRTAELNRESNFSIQLQKRTKTFSVRLIHLADALPNKTSAWVVGKQVLKSGTSIGANYYEACRARSKAEFIAIIGTVAKEAAETIYWLEILGESGIVPAQRLQGLLKEAHELTAIFTASYNTASGKSNSAVRQFGSSQMLNG